MSDTLEQRRRDVLRIFHDADDATRAFQEQSGLTCPEGCGRCCENPRIEATTVEMLPMALALMEQGRGDEMHARARERHGHLCVFFEQHGDGKGRCTAYAWRPTLCRLFGYAGVRRKHGARELAVCAVHSVEQADIVIDAMDRVERGELALPVFSDHARAVMSLDPVDGRTPMPINDALAEALEKVLFARDVIR